MPVQITDDACTVTAVLSGEIDHHNAVGLRREIDAAVERVCPEELVLDFGGVTFMDSAGIGLVMGRWRLMQALHGEVRVENAPGAIKKVMRVAGLQKLLESQRRGKKETTGENDESDQ